MTHGRRTVTGMRRAVVRLAVVAAVCVTAGASVAACGDDTVSPKTWVAAVCGSLGPWRARIADLNASAQTAMTSAKTAEDTRTRLLDLLDGAARASEAARAAVAGAGVPDVDGGAEIERRFVASLVKVRDAYRRADAAITALPTGDETAFYAGVTTAMTRLNTDYAASGVDTDGLVSDELKHDFDEVATCRS